MHRRPVDVGLRVVNLSKSLLQIIVLLDRAVKLLAEKLPLTRRKEVANLNCIRLVEP